MKRIMPRVLLALLVSTLRGLAAQPAMSDADYWRTTTLDLDYAKHFISNERCYSTAKYLFSCIQAANAAGSLLERPVRIVPDDGLAPDEHALSRVPALAVIRDNRPIEPSTAGQPHRVEKERLRLMNASAASFGRRNNAGSRIDFEHVLRKIHGDLPPRVPVQRMLGAAISAHLKVFDAHASIIPTKLVEDRFENPEWIYVGIGVSMRTIADGARVDEIFPGAPAELAGLRVGDIITEITPKPGDKSLPAGGKQADAIGELIDGRIRTPVALKIRRGGITLNFIISRAAVHKPSVNATILHRNNHSFGYVRIWSFEQNGICEKVRGALLLFQQNHVEGVILDLRRNGGGQMNVGVCVAGLFLGVKTAVGIKSAPVTLPGRDELGRDASSEMIWLHGHSSKPSELPLVVIIDAGSASASEIVASALQFYERAWLVGERSYGKGTVQTLSIMEDNDTLTLSETTELFYRPDGLTIQRVGIAPDFEVPFQMGASPSDWLAAREEDEFHGTLPASNAVPPRQRPGEAAAIRGCVKKAERNGKGVLALAGATDTGDYQKAYAGAVLACSLAQVVSH